MAQDLENVAKERAPEVACRMLAAAGPSRTEADFRREAARILEAGAPQACVTIASPKDEYQVARGRVDSVYNRLVVKYERPGTFRESNASLGNKHAI
jgi:hypothetical protein